MTSPSQSGSEGPIDRATTATAPQGQETGIHEAAEPQPQQPQPQQPPDAPESEEIPGLDIPPGSLHIELAVSRELFGAEHDHPRPYTSYDNIATHGPAAYGNNNTVTSTYVVATSEPSPQVAMVRGVPRLLAGYTPSSSYSLLEGRLRTRRVVSLAGAPGTGRFTTACAVLADRYGPDRICEILLPADEPRSQLQRQVGLAVQGHGHVLRLPGRDHGSLIHLLEDQFSRAEASLILIRDAGTHDSYHRSGTVYHTVSAAMEVFRTCLRQLLFTGHPSSGPAMAPAEVDGYLEEILAMSCLGQTIDEASRTTDLAAMAALVARTRPRTEQAMERALTAAPPRRRRRAMGILLPGGPDDDQPHRRLGQYERSFRIAYAVFHRHPVHHVFASTGWLLQQIGQRSHRFPQERPALEYSVPELLGRDLATDWSLAQAGDTRSPESVSRMAWLCDEGMRGAILDIAWHEFDNTRPALLGWLDHLANTGDTVVERAAAETAGLLAHFDFDEVCRHLIDNWAGSARPSVRQAAAWVVTVAHFGGRGASPVSHKVRDKVREWAWGSRARQRDTAARVYASGFSQLCLDWTLADLRHIAADPMQRRSRVIAEAINQLYQPDQAGLIIAELVSWIDAGSSNGDLAAHATRSFLVLAGKSSEDDAEEQPELLRWLMSGEADAAHLTTLWAVALLNPTSADPAWKRLHVWLRQADADPPSRTPMSQLLVSLTEHTSLRRRLPYYLHRMWQALREQPPEWIMTVIREPHHE
ncbi:MAG: hypothetical protein JXA67_13415 [Micromonosporaceae bacterium]|nr:hypothetical protein [Micromonosporaceae bacterium]